MGGSGAAQLFGVFLALLGTVSPGCSAELEGEADESSAQARPPRRLSALLSARGDRSNPNSASDPNLIGSDVGFCNVEPSQAVLRFVLERFTPVSVTVFGHYFDFAAYHGLFLYKPPNRDVLERWEIVTVRKAEIARQPSAGKDLLSAYYGPHAESLYHDGYVFGARDLAPCRGGPSWFETGIMGEVTHFSQLQGRAAEAAYAEMIPLVKSYPCKNEYFALGVNSNTFAQWILNQLGWQITGLDRVYPLMYGWEYAGAIRREGPCVTARSP